MAVKYKKNGTWYDISSSSNNAVDTVENSNLNPVTSNAVYDALTPVDITDDITIDTSNFTKMSAEFKVFKVGKLVIATLKGNLLTNAGYVTLASGFPKPLTGNNVMNFTFVVDTGAGIASGSGYIEGGGLLRSRFTGGKGEFAASFVYVTA